MAQRLKDDIQERISDAALKVFARSGYRAATMAEIAEAAGISAGNIYRYFPDKERLFRAVVPDEFARSFAERIRRRVRALDGVDDVRALGRDAPYHLISEELLRFCIDNRLRVVVLLGRAEGTRHAPFAGRMVQDLVELAIAHARSTTLAFPPRESATFSLELIYRNFVSAIASTLASFEDEARIREAVAALSSYHLAGLRSFFDEVASSPGRKARR